MNESTKVVSNLIWRFAERCGAQGITFVVSIILARILNPKLYGTVALVSVFITILQVFIDSGLGNALIQKKDADALDFSTVFYCNIVVCILLYLLLFFCSPFIAEFYDDMELVPIIRALGIILIVSGVKNVQQAYVSRNLLFKKFFYSTLGGTIGAAIIGIYLAFQGYGVWALVIQQLFNTITDTIILWFTVKWRPRLQFSLSRLKVLYSYGWKLFLSSFIDEIYNDLRQLLIGKFYSASDLAYYNRGKQFPNLIVLNINKTIDSVLFPVLSNNQSNAGKIRELTRLAIRFSSYLMWPLMIGLAVIAEPLVNVVLTSKWLDCVPILQMFCLIFAFYPIHTANLNAIKALGHSDIFLKLEIEKKIIGILALFITLPFGIIPMTFGLLITTIIGSFINAKPNLRLLGYGYIDQIKDCLPTFLLSVMMGILIYPIQFLNISSISILLLQITTGVLIYIIESILFKMDTFHFILNYISKILKRKETYS